MTTEMAIATEIAGSVLLLLVGNGSRRERRVAFPSGLPFFKSLTSRPGCRPGSHGVLQPLAHGDHPRADTRLDGPQRQSETLASSLWV